MFNRYFITVEEDLMPIPKAGPSMEQTGQVQKATHRKKRGIFMVLLI